MAVLDLHDLASHISRLSEAMADRQAGFLHAHVFHPLHHTPESPHVRHQSDRFTQSLIRCPSPPGEESAVVDLILAEMRAVGFDAFWRDDVGNAVGVIMGGEPGPTLLLDSHCDTVGIAPGVPGSTTPSAPRSRMASSTAAAQRI